MIHLLAAIALLVALYLAALHTWRDQLQSPGALIVDALFAWARWWFCVAGAADAWRMEWHRRKMLFAIERAELR